MSTRHPSYGYRPHDAERVDAIVTKFCQCPNCGTKSPGAGARPVPPSGVGDAATGAAPTDPTHGTVSSADCDRLSASTSGTVGGGTIAYGDSERLTASTIDAEEYDADWWLDEDEDDERLPLGLIFGTWLVLALVWALAWAVLR